MPVGASDAQLPDSAPAVTSLAEIRDLCLESSRRAIEQSEQSWQKRSEKFLSMAAEDTKRQLKESEAAWDKRFKAMEASIEGVRAESRIAPSSAGASIASRPATTTPTGWAPSLVDIKGWVADWDCLEQQGLTVDETHHFVQRIFAGLAPDVAAMIDKDHTTSLNSRVVTAKISLVVKGGKDCCFKVRAAIGTLVEGDMAILPRPGVRVKVSVEAEPHKRPMFKAAGKAIGTLKKHGADIETMRWEWSPFKIYRIVGGTRPTLVMRWTEDEGYVIDPAALDLVLPGWTPERFTAAMR
jgi:hypothetical protein